MMSIDLGVEPIHGDDGDEVTLAVTLGEGAEVPEVGETRAPEEDAVILADMILADALAAGGLTTQVVEGLTNLSHAGLRTRAGLDTHGSQGTPQ
jgi:hypothetical protein